MSGQMHCADRSYADWRMRHTHRRGVTLMEVVFAVGVVVIGLVGVAALVPVAANNARVALEIDRSIGESTSASAAGAVQALNDLDSLVIFDKPVRGSGYVADKTYVPSNRMQTLRWKIGFQSSADPPVFSGSGSTVYGKLESPGYSHLPLGSGLQSGICVDPFGMPDLNLAPDFAPLPNGETPFAAPTGGDSAFDYSRFPYYNERYSLLAPPNASMGSPTPAPPPDLTGNTPPMAPPWPMSPRMWRATLKAPMYVGFSEPVLRHQLLPHSASRKVFQGSAGLSALDGTTNDEPRSMLLSRSNIGGNLVDIARDGTSDYTWFATITPPVLGGSLYRQAIVVVRKRIPAVPTRAKDPFALRKLAYNLEDEDDNPSAERIAYVAGAIGFDAGAGGDVQLVGSAATSDAIEAGEWVMLSRQPYDIASGAPHGPAIHRWFRVLRTNDPVRIPNYTLPGSSSPRYSVWSRWVSLAGPDWTFQSETTSNTTPIDDTVCTIVTGAISVIESDVVMQ